MLNNKLNNHFIFLVSELLGLSFILQQHDIVFLVSSDQHCLWWIRFLHILIHLLCIQVLTIYIHDKDKISAHPHTFVIHTNFDYIHTWMNSLCELVCIYYVHVVCMEHTYYPHWPHKPQMALFTAKHCKLTVIGHSFHGRSRPKQAYYVWSWAEIFPHVVVFFSTTPVPTKWHKVYKLLGGFIYRKQANFFARHD